MDRSAKYKAYYEANKEKKIAQVLANYHEHKDEIAQARRKKRKDYYFAVLPPVTISFN
jgi:hypothetical protein